jgi:deoxyribonuclease-4
MKFGAHISTAGKFSLAIDRAVEEKCETIQIFANQPQRWNPTVIPQDELGQFVKKNKEAGINPVVIHSIYLVNLASDNPFYLSASIKSLADDLVKAKAIEALGVNTHIGSTKGRDEKACNTQVVKAIKQILDTVPAGPNFIIENSAGAGHVIGDKFSEIGNIIREVNSDRLKVTLDTAHAYESGYDLKTASGLERMLEEFDKEIGLERLVFLHLNDSKTPFSSNRDIHADIGEGEIGLEAFRRLVNHPKLRELPGVIETPSLKGKSAIDNLEILRSL